MRSWIKKLAKPLGKKGEKIVSGEERFFFANSKSAGSIKELHKALLEMDDNTFYHHVNSERNDFANWIKGVFREYDLADNLNNSHNKEDTKRILEEHLGISLKHISEPEWKPPPTEEVEEPARLSEKKEAPKLEQYHEELLEDHHLEPKHENKVEHPDVSDDSDDGFGEEVVSNEEYEEVREIKNDTREEVELHPDERNVYKEEEGRPINQEELRHIVDETKDDLEDVLEKQIKRHHGNLRAHHKKLHKLEHRVVVQEFVYGFIIGLIFGLFMSGILRNLG